MEVSRPYKEKQWIVSGGLSNGRSKVILTQVESIYLSLSVHRNWQKLSLNLISRLFLVSMCCVQRTSKRVK